MTQNNNMGSCSRKWTCYLSGPGKPLKVGLYLRKMTLVRPFMSPKSYLHKRSGHSRRVAGLRGSDMLRGKARAQLTAHVCVRSTPEIEDTSSLEAQTQSCRSLLRATYMCVHRKYWPGKSRPLLLLSSRSWPALITRKYLTKYAWVNFLRRERKNGGSGCR